MGNGSSKVSDVEEAEKGVASPTDVETDNEEGTLMRRRNGHDVLAPTNGDQPPNGESNEDKAITVLDYFKLLADNPDFFLYTISFCITIASEYLTVIANMTMLEEFQGATKNYLWISAYIVIKQFTSGISALILGGALADSTDRRNSMVKLDILAAFVALLNFAALHYRSKVGVLAIVFLYQLVAGAYDPCRSAIVPTLFQHSRREMRMAIVLTITFAYGVMAPLGSAGGGFIAEYLGLKFCFAIDSLAFLLSALLLSMMKGSFLPRAEEKIEFDPTENLVARAWRMMKEGMAYARDKFWRLLICFRGTLSGFHYGAMEVLYVSFAESLPGSTTLNLAWLYFAVGIGSFLGPVVSSGRQTYYDIQYTGIFAGLVMMISLAAIGMSNALLDTLWSVCFFNVLRSSGTRGAGVNARLLLNSFPEDRMLGRVMSLEYVFAVTMAAAGAVTVGVLEDKLGMTATDVTFCFFGYNSLAALFWISYQMRNLGGASPEALKFNKGTVGIAKAEQTETDDENNHIVLREKAEERSSYSLVYIWFGIVVLASVGIYYTLLEKHTTWAILEALDGQSTTDLMEESSVGLDSAPDEASMPHLSDFGFQR